MSSLGSGLLGFFTLLALALGAGGISFTQVHASAVVYDHALVLRPRTTTFDSVPVPLAPDLAPYLFRDEGGLGIEASSIGGDHAVLRWDGTTFAPGAMPSGTAEAVSMFDTGEPIALGDASVDFAYDEPTMTLTTPTGASLPVTLPASYSLRTVVAAGPGRALLVPEEAETRTFLLDTTSGALTPGPSTPPYMSTLAASDPDGTVVILPGATIEVTRWSRLVVPAVAEMLGVLGIGALVWGGSRGALSIGAAAVGAVVGIAAALAFVIAGFVLLASFTLPL